MTARGEGYRDAWLPDMMRRVAQTVQIGIVKETDYSDEKKPRVKVQVGPRVSGWLPFSQGRSGDNSEWNPLDIDEQVMIFSPGGDMKQAVVGFTLPRADRPAPGKNPNQSIRRWKDGSTETHDRAEKTHVLEVPAGGKIVLKCGASSLEITDAGTTLTTPDFKVDSPTSQFTGKLTVRGLFTYLAGLIGRNSGGGAVAQMSGPVEHSDGDFSSNGIVIHRHTHPDSDGPPNGNA